MATRPKYDRIKPPDPADPMLHQADRLPNFIKGADGNDPNAHVSSASAEGGDPGVGEVFDEDDLGGGIGDASTLTAD